MAQTDMKMISFCLELMKPVCLFKTKLPVLLNGANYYIKPSRFHR